MSSFVYDVANLTSTILNRTKRHDDFLVPIDLTECRIDHQDFEERCDYLSETDHDSCFESIELIDYTTFLFCFGTRSYFHYCFCLAVIILFCLYMFLILGITADQFFCPALTVIAQSLKMSESFAGITVLAFGNGAPDLFTALADPHGDTELMYNELMGGGAFLVSIIGGAIIAIRSFRMDSFKLLRDCLFFMLAINYIGYAIHDKKFSIREALIIISIYVAYILVVVVEVFMGQGGDVIKVTKYEPIETEEKPSLLVQMLISLNPFDGDDDETNSRFSYYMKLIRVPIIVTLRLLIPIVDYSIQLDGWSKLLNMFHCLILPQLVLFVTERFMYFVWRIPLALIVFAASMIFFVMLGCLTKQHKTPKYHVFMSLLSFVGSICVIYKVANEIMAILNVIGQATGLTNSILGITILSWGNSVGDLVSNIVLAKKGYSKFGFSGCFGGAMFNCLTGMGVTFVLKLSASKNNVAYGREGAMGPNCTVYLFLLLLFIIMAFLLTNFFARRVIGIYMITIYIIFVTFCCFNEADLVHPFGTDHNDQLHIQFG